MTTYFERWHCQFASSVAVCCLALLVASGCESKSERYDLSGTVTYQGNPVPAGYMVISPDTGAGNSGPGSTASIVNGEYATLPGRGTIGGPHVLTVFGFDGKAYTMNGGIPNSMGKPLCKAEVKADLPVEHTKHAIALPAKAP